MRAFSLMSASREKVSAQKHSLVPSCGRRSRDVNFAYAMSFWDAVCFGCVRYECTQFTGVFVETGS